MDMRWIEEEQGVKSVCFRCDDRGGKILKVLIAEDGDLWLSLADDPTADDTFPSSTIRLRMPVIGGGSHSTLFDGIREAVNEVLPGTIGPWSSRINELNEIIKTLSQQLGPLVYQMLPEQLPCYIADLLPPDEEDAPPATKHELATAVENCARCGGDHPAIRWRTFTMPNPNYTYWGICPCTGEPIMMKVVD